ncbi:NADH:flavin oxidoreductase [Sphingosinicella xenopeptidilytica]|uniref:NADH:flavin oxidoreductase n=1 Tax=Sphingosinicella xenopeptidilytica TaxID=364098 RepID=A0ABW3C3M6_SPHXN
MTDAAEVLFRPFRHGTLDLSSRVVMAPMTRSLSPGGVPGPDVARYYRRRAENGVGLIISEGTFIDHAGASIDDNVPRFHGEKALDGWARVIREVHAAGGRMVPQLWHAGLIAPAPVEGVFEGEGGLRGDQVGPSGMVGGPGVMPWKGAEPMSLADIDAVVEAFVSAAASAFRLGFDGVELHAAHGYLIDQFFWQDTNRRTDNYGGGIAQRSRFAADIVRAIKAATSPDFPVILRISQWKQHDFDTKMLASPQELEAFLSPLVEAGVDIFHCSQRRYWQPEFESSDLNFAGWVRRLSSLPAISVGSVGLKDDLLATLFAGKGTEGTGIDRLLAMMERGDFDLIAVGRALLADPEWLAKVRAGDTASIRPYTVESLKSL